LNIVPPPPLRRPAKVAKKPKKVKLDKDGKEIKPKVDPSKIKTAVVAVEDNKPIGLLERMAFWRKKRETHVIQVDETGNPLLDDEGEPLLAEDEEDEQKQKVSSNCC
jgi:hypothetical protein